MDFGLKARYRRMIYTIWITTTATLIIVVYFILFRKSKIDNVPLQDFVFRNTSFGFRNTSIFTNAYSHKIHIYLKILEKSIKIIRLPPLLGQETVNRCLQYKHRGKLNKHQHSSELYFPYLLEEMSYSSLSNFHPLQSPTTTTPPLFYYVEAYPYHAIFCSNLDGNREDWNQRDIYWRQVAEYLITIPSFKENFGLDYVTIASHPMSGPIKIHPFSVSYLHRTTFLRTDYDISGSAPKDIIIPYFTSEIEIFSKISFPGPLLLYFNGGHNPKEGYRTLLSNTIQDYLNSINPRPTDIIYSLQPIPAQEYISYMMRSKFCLCVRGDTKSSRRLFTAVAVNCIPVIIADWIELPFESIIDYNRFVIRFPESIIHRIPDMIKYLRNITSDQIELMKRSLTEAKDLLLYPSMLSNGTLTILGR